MADPEEDQQQQYRLINIDLRWDSSRQVVIGATGKFHRSPSDYKGVDVSGLSIPFDEQLDWNILRDELYAEARRE